MRVLLLAGSWSPEAEVSLSGAKGIKAALEERGHNVTLCDPVQDFDKLIVLAKEHDVTFINLHGSPGEDGIIQAMLERAGCAYQGSSASSSLLALHKAAAKQVFRNADINTADWHFLPVRPAESWKPDFDYPLFIKSNLGGSSINMAKIENEEQLHKELNTLFDKNLEVIVEPMIQGIELTCGVLEMQGKLQALPPVLIKPKDDTFFDYHNKYAKDGAEEICPAPLAQELIEEIQSRALRAHKALGLSSYSRSDFIYSNKEELFILETNTIPGMTPKSLVPQEAAAIGISFGELLEILLQNAILKNNSL